MAKAIAETKATEPVKCELIKVRSLKVQKKNLDRYGRDQGGSEVVLFERHPDHPGGEAWIDDQQVHVVARTPRVIELIRNEVLALVKDDGGEASVR